MSLVEFIPEQVTKAAIEAFGTFAEKLAQAGVKDDDGPPKEEEPKSYFVDPDMMADSFGMGYRNIPSRLSDNDLRNAAKHVDIISSIILLRKNQITSFCQPQPNKYSVGFRFKPRWGNPARRLSDSERDRVDYLTHFLVNTGVEYNLKRGSLTNLLRKVVPDSLTLDRGCFEKVWTRGGSLHSIHAVDAGTVRIAHPKNRRGTPPSTAELKNRIEYAQVIDARKVREYTSDELAFLVRNPSTDIRSFGYGLSEVEILVQTITWLLWALTYNAKGFSQGTTAKGILNIKGKLNERKLEELRKSWYQQLVGVGQAWKTPIVNSDEIQWVPFQATNKEMEYQLWVEFLVKCACAVFLVDPAEINHDLRGSVAQQPLFMSTNEAQQKASKDRGLRPLLHFYAESLNNHVVWPIDDQFEFEFVGLDAKTEEQAVELRAKQGQTYLTVNEVRELEDLGPLKEGGDIIMNPAYIAALQFKAQMAQQQQAAGGDASQAAAQPQHEEDRMFEGEDHGHEEHQGAQRLLDAASRIGEKKIAPVPVDEGFLRDDWVSSVHASVSRDNDLRKGEKQKRDEDEYLIIDME